MKNLFDLRGERIFITGAGGAIGGATARVCATLGAEVYVADFKSPDDLAKDIGARAAFALDAYPMKRFGQPGEIGWPSAFLASRGATFTTGAVLDVNGGMCFS